MPAVILPVAPTANKGSTASAAAMPANQVTGIGGRVQIARPVDVFHSGDKTELTGSCDNVHPGEVAGAENPAAVQPTVSEDHSLVSVYFLVGFFQYFLISLEQFCVFHLAFLTSVSQTLFVIITLAIKAPFRPNTEFSVRSYRTI